MRRIEVPEYIRGLIFDCDGTLVDSMPLHMTAWEHTIRSKNGKWEPEFFVAKKGMPERKIVELYNRRYGTAYDPAETVEAKHAFFRARAAELKPIPHVVDVVTRYRDVLPMAIASGGTRENVKLELRVLGIEDCFKAIVTADDGHVPPKPSPGIFLEAARRIGVAPELCQVFEDGDLGLEAARAAGMLPTDIRLYR
jgi:HAD superfamily hydrolase (TIGR01509 family)